MTVDYRHQIPVYLYDRTIARLCLAEIPKMDNEQRWEFVARFQAVWDARNLARSAQKSA